MNKHPANSSRRLCAGAALLAAALLPLGAAITLPHNQGELSLSATVSGEYDSNIFATADATHDFLATGAIDILYKREARYALDAAASMRSGRFDQNSGQNFLDPSFRAAISTQVGANHLRLGGSATRTHEANSLISGRSDQWADAIDLRWQRTIRANYDVDFSAGYRANRYQTSGLNDLRTSFASLDVFRRLNPKLSAFAGYRLSEDTANGFGRAIDQSLTTGLSRQILPRINGSVRVGWTTRDGRDDGLNYSGLTSTVDLKWTPSTRFSLALSGDRGVKTAPRGGSLETQSGQLDATWQIAGKFTASAAFSAGSNRFLNLFDRTDRYFTLRAGLDYQAGARVTVSLSGSQTENRSNLSSEADYLRRQASTSINYRW